MGIALPNDMKKNTAHAYNYQRTEDRGQKTEDRGQKTDKRRQRAEYSGQKTEDQKRENPKS